MQFFRYEVAHVLTFIKVELHHEIIDARRGINFRGNFSISNGRGITCAQGERRLRNRGWRDVRRIDCRGSHFVYRGWRGGNRYEVVLRSRDGRVVSVRRIRR